MTAVATSPVHVAYAEAAVCACECLVPNETQTDGRDGRAKDASGRALNDSRSQDGREVRPQSEGQ
jgi:hypothetical protein